MNRRDIVLALLAFAGAPFAANAQPTARAPRIRVLESSSSSESLQAFKRGFLARSTRVLTCRELNRADDLLSFLGLIEETQR